MRKITERLKILTRTKNLRIAGGIFSLFLALTTFIGVYALLTGSIPLFTKAGPNPSTFNLTPAQVDAIEGETFTLTVNLAPQGNAVYGVDVILNYDPAYLEALSVANLTNGKCPAEVSHINKETGEVSFICLTYNGSQVTSPMTSDTPVLAVEFLAVAPTTSDTQISFNFQTNQTFDSNIAVWFGQSAADALLQAPGSASVAVIPCPDINIQTVAIRARLQGVTDSGRIDTLNTTFKKGNTVTYSQTDTVTSGAEGVFDLSIDNQQAGLTSCVYDVTVKGSSHLRKRYARTIIDNPTPIFDFSQDEKHMLRAGDVTNDNVLSIEDVAQILVYYTDFSVPVNPQDPKMVSSDVNKDGLVTIQDIALLAINWSDFEIFGEE